MARKILNLFEKNLLANSRDFFFIQKIYLFTKNLFGYKKFHKKYIESEKNHKKKTQSVGKKEKKIIFPAVIKKYFTETKSDNDLKNYQLKIYYLLI